MDSSRQPLSKIIFITFGENGACLFAKNRGSSAPSFKIKAIDPTGCGDAFCAGIIYEMIEWEIYKDIHKLPANKLREMLIYAQAAGASAATAAGCTEGVSKKKVKEILEDKQ